MVLNVLVVRDALMMADVVYIDTDDDGRFSSWLAYMNPSKPHVPVETFLGPTHFAHLEP